MPTKDRWIHDKETGVSAEVNSDRQQILLDSRLVGTNTKAFNRLVHYPSTPSGGLSP